MQTTISGYLADGCGRCAHFATDHCKARHWQRELILLRDIVTTTPLTETIKWGAPCYTYEDKNVLMIAAFKDCAFISFFKGSLLQDTSGLLNKAGENSNSGMLIKFTSVDQIQKATPTILELIQQAIEVEKQGLQVPKSNEMLPIPEELTEMFARNEGLQEAFEALTLGRQKGYLLHFSQAKQSSTKIDRIEKNLTKIFQGKGLHDR